MLWTSRSIKSRLVQQQAEIAAGRGILLGVRIEPVTPPMWEEGFPNCDLLGWNGDTDAPGFRQLIQAISVMAPIRTKEAADQATQKVFICYRRDDTQDAAGRLRDKLVDAYGPQRVFMDIDSVPLGVNFVTHINQQVQSCAAVLVMIGRGWTTMTDPQGNRRLDDPADHVRVEVATALTQGVPVIPILVQNASMPRAAELPEDIRDLAFYNGMKLAPEFWRAGVERPIKELDRVMKTGTQPGS